MLSKERIQSKEGVVRIENAKPFVGRHVIIGWNSVEYMEGEHIQANKLLKEHV